jgi:predicted negative regulator of RcsB-dependent stress response
MADALLTDEQRAIKQIKKGDALVEAGELETAVTVYNKALALFGGKRPKLEQKIAETVRILLTCCSPFAHILLAFWLT